MDFWGRLVRGSTPQKKRPTTVSGPQVRLAQLKRVYNSLLQIWHNGDGVSDDAFVVENVQRCLHRLSELLNEDQRGPTPHLCISFAATSRILVTVARISTAFQNDAVTHEALSICSSLIDSEEEEFLEDRAFADSLPDFIESIQKSLRHAGDPNIESSMVELLFGITAKLRFEPHVLRVWFRPEKPEEEDEELSDDEKRTRWEEFPLFYLLLGYVPSEGRAGEFGRMGLLYIIEMAPNSSDLEKWLVQGDMAALMASSLGALYSQLGRKLALKYREGEAPSILIFSERLGADVPADVESTISAEYQAHLGTFLASLVFWQDLLEHCTSDNVKQTLLDHFRYLFLQQLLYPSLLESSDIDGGSSVAVLTYLRHILESIDHPDLVKLILQYLFGLQQHSEDTSTPKTPTFKARRRKSQTLIAQLAQEDQPTPELFNLADLIMTSLRSQSQQTITATLHILSAMLQRPHHQSLTTLLRTRPVQALDTKRTVGGHEKEVEIFLSLAEHLTAFQDLESSYEKHVIDNRNNLELHPCTVQLLSLPVGNKTAQALESEKRALTHKLMILEDPTFKSLVILLDNFFHNDIETNLGVTQVLIDLASCGYMHLEGWLLTSPKSYEYPNLPPPPQRQEDSAEHSLNELHPDKLHQMKLCRLPPQISLTDSSPIIQSLTHLNRTVDAFRRTIPSFDAHLISCRGIVEPASPSHSPSMTPSRSPNRLDGAWTPQMQPKHSDVSTPNLAPTPLPSRLMPSGSTSRTASPRGRQSQNDLPPELGTPPSLVSRLGLQASPSRSPSNQSATHTPTKNQSRSPLRRGITLNTPASPAIPDVLRRRVRVTHSVSGRAPSGAYSRPPNNVLDSSDDSDTETSSVDGKNTSGDGAAETTPIKFAVTKSPTRIKRTRSLGSSQKPKKLPPGLKGHRKTASSVSNRGRDASLDDASEDSDEDAQQGEIGVTSPTTDDNDTIASNVVGRSTLKIPPGSKRDRAPKSGKGAGNNDGMGKGEGLEDTISLGTLCTNVIILQEFALELAAIVEVRGALFEEVRYL